MRNECMKSKLHFNRPLPVEDVVTSLSESKYQIFNNNFQLFFFFIMKIFIIHI